MGKSKDFTASFESLKKFKEEHAELTEKDEFFKSLYTRMRKYVKKWNKIQETEVKTDDGSKLTKEQKQMLDKRQEIETSLEELDFAISQYTQHFKSHLKLIWKQKPETAKKQEEVKEEVTKEEEPQTQQEPEEKEPEVDLEAVKKEEFDRGFAEGRNLGYDEGKKTGYDEGKEEGISHAKQEFESQEPQISTEDIERAVSYYSLIHVMGHWVDSFVLLNPQFKRTDYFTDEECLALKQIYIAN